MVRCTARLVIAAPASGHGKTTVATGLMAALSSRGLAVAPFKVGPDYIDPGYHTLAAGRPGRNLDPVLCGEALVAPLFAHGSQDCDIAVIEGVMGLFDGRLGSRGFGSTAHVARLLKAPVLLVVDVRHTSRSAAALVAGMSSFDPDVEVAGVVLNQIGSPRHEKEVRDAIAELGIPVVGALPRTLAIEAPSRHLGLVPAAERDDSGIRAMGEAVAAHLDLDAILALAGTAEDLACTPWTPGDVVAPPSARRPRVAVAAGRAFTFRYAETDELLVAAGCEPVIFDPMTDPSLPDDVSGLWLGGGFPEVHASDLHANHTLLADIRQQVNGGLPTVAECAGLLYLCEQVDGHGMVGAIPATAHMGARLTMGYRNATSAEDTLLGRIGETVTGHEFHRTVITDDADATATRRFDPAAWILDGRADGIATATLHASYLHVHWAGHPQLAQRFADAVHQHAAAVECFGPSGPDVWHHGDRDLRAGLVDFAVNVRRPRPPDWLMEELTRDVDWASYPDATPARKAIAAHHGVEEAMVLPVAGAAEAFTLIARAIGGSSLVVHPQFTETEAALLAAGRNPQRHLLRADDGFALHPLDVPHADLVMVGNPTNPTAVLHTSASLRQLEAEVVVVDEAFMDCIPGQAESLISADMTGQLVLRSLTKTWALAGIRAGYVVGDPALIRLLTLQQPPWSVSTPAVTAMVACLRDGSRLEADALAREGVFHRMDLAERLHQIGLSPVPGSAPFVLVDTSPICTTSLREPLAGKGFAVRRGETFPGLGPSWLRLAVRTPSQHHRLVEALAQLKEETCTQP
ncbi:cobyrinate a,c-diamide synthase [Tessaracoccus antarcticus]|uniref:Hydrogenobyrinate a,c-diamide synthase n=1 Tax=Tessaracoccus antarcticus TaxID=2479848 RepID=A0A3M0G9F2_9ACTN|nr:cobyrinate a,c-diamide synthase [Tessaracoccus antarcticus]RMB61631.1 cobyrinate a,c-diamide synthase [Tessaracoccus antarcticus]